MKKHKNGFIQIPILIGVIGGVLILGVVGFSYSKYQKTNTEKDLIIEELSEKISKIEQDKITDENEKEIKLEEPITEMPKVTEKIIIKEIPVYIEKETQEPLPIEELKITNITAIPSSYSAEIKWNTNLTSDSKITLWPTNTETGNLVRYTSDNKNHSVIISLLPNKTYYYTIEVTDKNSNTAFSEQKEFTTPTDNVSPTIEKINITSEKDKGIINFIIYANEPIRAILTYSFKYSPVSGGDKETIEQNIIYDKELEKYIIDKNYYNPYTITISKPSYTSSTELNYSLGIVDQSGNPTFKDGDIKVHQIEGI